MATSAYKKYEDGEVHFVQNKKPDTFRSNLYKYARRHTLNANAYIDWKTMPHPTVVFAVGAGVLPELPDKPKRGRPEVSDD